MKEHEVTLWDIQMAYVDGRLTLEEALDCARATGRTGVPPEYYTALGIDQ